MTEHTSLSQSRTGTVALYRAFKEDFAACVLLLCTFVQDFLDDTVESCSTRAANLSPTQLRDTLQAATGLITQMLPTQLDKWAKQARDPGARASVDRCRYICCACMRVCQHAVPACCASMRAHAGMPEKGSIQER